MSENDVAIGTLTLFNHRKGEIELKNGQSFTIQEEYDFSDWLDRNFPNEHPQWLSDQAAYNKEGNIDYLFQYYSFDQEKGHYVGPESHIEAVLERHGLLATEDEYKERLLDPVAYIKDLGGQAMQALRKWIGSSKNISKSMGRLEDTERSS